MGRPERGAALATEVGRKEAASQSEVLEQAIHFIGDASHHRKRPAAISAGIGRCERAAAGLQRAAGRLLPSLTVLRAALIVLPGFLRTAAAVVAAVVGVLGAPLALRASIALAGPLRSLRG